MRRMVRMRMAAEDDEPQSAILSQDMTEQRTSIFGQDSQEMHSMALVHLITPSLLSSSLQLSILPSFLSSLPPPIHTLSLIFIVPLELKDEFPAEVTSKLSYFSLEYLQNGCVNDGVANLWVTIDHNDVTVTFREHKHGTAVDSNNFAESFTRTFSLLPEHRSKTIFATVVALHSHLDFHPDHHRTFVPISDEESWSAPPNAATIIQLSNPSTPELIPCPISLLPIEVLSRIFHHYKFDDYYDEDAEDLTDSKFSEVCQLWRRVSVPFLPEPSLINKKHALLKLYPDAGRLWRDLWVDKHVSFRIMKRVIMGSPNVRNVRLCHFWDEDEAEILLKAIAELTGLEAVSFYGKGSRKWKKVEVETFTWRMSRSIQLLTAHDVEDSSPCYSASSASESLLLPPRLTGLDLRRYPPLPLLSLPRTLRQLILGDLCSLPPSIPSSPLPPFLDTLHIKLAPSDVDGKVSTLPTPLDLSHLTRLTSLYLDGGDETSNLVSCQFFGTLKNAKAMRSIKLAYCMVDSLGFPEFVRWFFLIEEMTRTRKGNTTEQNVSDEEENRTRGDFLQVFLFFGDWHEGEIGSARRTMRECAMRKFEKGAVGVWDEFDEEPSDIYPL